jgi:hypothetical protein
MLIAENRAIRLQSIFYQGFGRLRIMNKTLPFFCVWLFTCVLLRAETVISPLTSYAGGQLRCSFSPKPKEFLEHHPDASKRVAEVLSNRVYGLYYYYSDEESAVRAFHSYPAGGSNGSPVSIVIRENQSASEEFIYLLFEALNSKAEDHFVDIIESGRAGKISKYEYARRILRKEFEAVKKTRDIVQQLNLSQSELSGYAQGFIQCPNDFEEFLSYLRKLSPNRSAFDDYERQYDWYRPPDGGHPSKKP